VMGLSIGQLYQKHFWVFLVFVMAGERIGRLYTPGGDLEAGTEYGEEQLTEVQALY